MPDDPLPPIRKIEPVTRWSDLSLPVGSVTQLREICQLIKFGSGINEGQGLVSGSRATGFTLLFSGPSGTGKTMAAEVLARELGRDLYRVDLSKVISKYIGETEKNLDKAFRDAAQTQAIILFDEADALFGKRSEVRDSHDRYANIEISYLAQRMGSYSGIMILATNSSGDLDPAFLARIAYTVNFPMQASRSSEP